MGLSINDHHSTYVCAYMNITVHCTNIDFVWGNDLSLYGQRTLD